MLTVLQGANLAARFLLEIAALVALAYWGLRLPAPMVWRVVAGLGAPLAAAALWGAFASPWAAIALPGPAVVAVQVLVLGAAVVALARAGRPGLATAFAIAAVVNAALMALWHQ
ncbi:YrdB family protein [Actinotalea sp.]|uniref:YrdB family protein n=1 Tax=Actinotalea sp. TaxID=1872145 RepID=UPI003561EC96